MTTKKSTHECSKSAVALPVDTERDQRNHEESERAHAQPRELVVTAGGKHSYVPARKACTKCQERHVRCVGMVLPPSYGKSGHVVVEAATACQLCASKGLTCLWDMRGSSSSMRRWRPHEQALSMMSRLSYVAGVAATDWRAKAFQHTAGGYTPDPAWAGPARASMGCPLRRSMPRQFRWQRSAQHDRRSSNRLVCSGSDTELYVPELNVAAYRRSRSAEAIENRHDTQPALGPPPAPPPLVLRGNLYQIGSWTPDGVAAEEARYATRASLLLAEAQTPNSASLESSPDHLSDESLLATLVAQEHPASHNDSHTGAAVVGELAAQRNLMDGLELQRPLEDLRTGHLAANSTEYAITPSTAGRASSSEPSATDLSPPVELGVPGEKLALGWAPGHDELASLTGHFGAGDVSQLDTIIEEQRLGYMRIFEATEVRTWYISMPDWTRQSSLSLGEYLQLDEPRPVDEAAELIIGMLMMAFGARLLHQRGIACALMTRCRELLGHVYDEPSAAVAKAALLNSMYYIGECDEIKGQYLNDMAHRCLSYVMQQAILPLATYDDCQVMMQWVTMARMTRDRPQDERQALRVQARSNFGPQSALYAIDMEVHYCQPLLYKPARLPECIVREAPAIMNRLEVALERLRLSQVVKATWIHGFVSARTLVAALSWCMGRRHDAVCAAADVTWAVQEYADMGGLISPALLLSYGLVAIVNERSHSAILFQQNLALLQHYEEAVPKVRAAQWARQERQRVMRIMRAAQVVSVVRRAVLTPAVLS